MEPAAPEFTKLAFVSSGIHKLEACVISTTKETCDNDHSAYVKSIIQGVAGDLLDTVCSKFEPGSSACKNLSPLKLSKSQKYITIIPPVVEILASLK